MKEMILSLGDRHSLFLSPQDVRQEEAEFSGDHEYVGIGVLTVPIPDREWIVILAVYPESPADRAGLSPHDSILAVDDQPILDDEGFRRELLHGPVGSSLTLTVQSPGQEARQVNMVRRVIQGSIPVPHRTLITPKGKRIGYIMLINFADNGVDDQVGEALQSLTKDEPLDGLILDNRQNSGGADNVTRGTLAYFTDGKLGDFINRYEEKHPLYILGSDINGSLSVPLVVLISPDTVSFGEIFAGVLQDSGRAYLIGEPTQGNIELLWGYNFEDGSRAWIAQESFRPQFHPDRDWEQTGVIPDQVVESQWDQVTMDRDPSLRAALDHFDALSDD